MNNADTQIAEALVLLNSALLLLDDAKQHAAAAEVNHVIQMFPVGGKTVLSTC